LIELGQGSFIPSSGLDPKSVEGPLSALFPELMTSYVGSIMCQTLASSTQDFSRAEGLLEIFFFLSFLQSDSL
jgi:hypothetical protein